MNFKRMRCIEEFSTLIARQFWLTCMTNHVQSEIFISFVLNATELTKQIGQIHQVFSFDMNLKISLICEGPAAVITKMIVALLEKEIVNQMIKSNL